ncbi:MAG TPA: DUF2127 domain-containing protein [Acidimicrobiales bacterium]|jgi:uncharacterized membrane protein (DUF2068 family)
MPTRPTNRYELVTCALRGHELVGTDVETITEADALVVLEHDGWRWHRCLRCDSWLPRAVPAAPARRELPARSEIEVPARGPILRDRYVLRLIALDRAVHVVILSVLAVVILFYLGHRTRLQHDYIHIMNALTGGSGGPDAVSGFLGKFRHLFVIQSPALHTIALALIAYAALEAVEMVGLWLAKRWAEYLTFVATFVFIPFEIYELTKSVTTLKMLAFVINLAILVYLLVAKRLFGVRGGYRAERARREAASGWSALQTSWPSDAFSDSGGPKQLGVGGRLSSLARHPARAAAGVRSRRDVEA